MTWLYIPEMENLAIDLDKLQSIKIHKDACSGEFRLVIKGNYPSTSKPEFKIPKKLVDVVKRKLEECLMRSEDDS